MTILLKRLLGRPDADHRRVFRDFAGVLEKLLTGR
ncbi:hypothetical protein QO014_004710 [Kaistia dalseonensis]|uniref:Uncharacterized protein n=1 Tax=Kaistia dalseonensis TaxID=410840 RepID=A0ABU0HDB6_9HYPH|nr:hypothetical protein [Kaistia dalseonensis]